MHACAALDASLALLNRRDAGIQLARGELIATLDATFDPSRHKDTYREAVLELIDRKAAGETGDDLVPAPAPSSDKVIDLMAALEASVKEAKKARVRHPAAGGATKGKTKAATKKKARKATKKTRAGTAKKAAKKAARVRKSA